MNTLKKLYDYVSYQPPDIFVWHPTQTIARQIPTAYASGAAVPSHISSPSSGYILRRKPGFTHGKPNYDLILLQEPNKTPNNQTSQPMTGQLFGQIVSAVTTVYDVIPGHYTIFTPQPYLKKVKSYGWTSSAASVDSFSADGHVSFSVTTASAGVVCGLNQLWSEAGSDYSNIDYAIYASLGFYQVIENGVTKTPAQTFTSGQVFIIQRQGSAVEYLLDGTLIYASSVIDDGSELVHDASLYASGDTINNASIAATVSSYGFSGNTALYQTGAGGPVTFTGTQTSPGVYTGSIAGTFTTSTNVTFTGTGGAGGSGSFTGTQTNPASYAGILTGTLTGTSSGTQIGSFTGTYNLVGGVWVFTADVGFTWGSTGTFNYSGTYTGTYTLVGGVWTFVADAGFTFVSTSTGVPAYVPAVLPPEPNHYYDAAFDVMTLTDQINVIAHLTRSLTDTIVLSDLDPSGKGNYLVLARSTENSTITTFNNMPFDGSCNFNGKTLFFNGAGLFEYGGSTDNGTAITASIKTDKSNKMTGQGGMYSSQHRKRIPTSKFYLNIEKTTDAMLKLTYNDDAPLEYPITNQKTGLQVYQRKIGRKQLYNSIMIELYGFDILESIEFEPEEVRRRGGFGN